MRYIAILLALIGIIGLLLEFGAFVRFPPPFNTMQTWGIVTAIGIVLFILTRRPRD